MNSNFTHNFQESLCADDRMVQHEYHLLLRLKCTGLLSLLQYYLQSNIGPLSTKIYTERLTQLLVFMDSSIFFHPNLAQFHPNLARVNMSPATGRADPNIS